jgi:hypothetical protein
MYLRGKVFEAQRKISAFLYNDNYLVFSAILYAFRFWKLLWSNLQLDTGPTFVINGLLERRVWSDAMQTGVKSKLHHKLVIFYGQMLVLLATLLADIPHKEEPITRRISFYATTVNVKHISEIFTVYFNYFNKSNFRKLK